MSNLGFSVAAAVLNFVQGLQQSHTFNYSAANDPRQDGEYTTDGAEAILYGVSVGTGRGSAKLELTGDQFPSVADALEAFSPDADLSGLSPAECVERTISRDKDGNTTFKLSLAKNSRTIKIPAGEWDNFLGYVRACSDSIPAAVAHDRAMVGQMESSEG